jgi:hypothetical protein
MRQPGLSDGQSINPRRALRKGDSMRRLGAVLIAVGVLLALGSTAPAANNSEQVVFSKTGAFSSTFGPLGLWIWCEADSGNPYQGECAGNVYFYAVTSRAFGVTGTISEGASGLYTMTVSSANGFISNCQFSNPNQAVHGPNNTLELDACTVNGTSFTGAQVITTTANVNVTGP